MKMRRIMMSFNSFYNFDILYKLSITKSAAVTADPADNIIPCPPWPQCCTIYQMTK